MCSCARMVATVHLAEPARRDVRVDLGRRDVRMPEERLHDPQVGPAGEEMGREGVAEGMWGDAAAEARARLPAPDELPDRLPRERPPARSEEDERARPAAEQPRAELGDV